MHELIFRAWCCVSESSGALQIFENSKNFILYEGDWHLLISDEFL